MVEAGWNKALQQVTVVAIFVWAVVGILDELGGYNLTGPLQFQLAGWRLAIASLLSLASVVLLRALQLIDRSLKAQPKSTEASGHQ